MENLPRVKSVFTDTVRKYDMLRDGESVLVGLSCGPDSMCLFTLLLEYALSHGITVYAAHVNHCIRGEESDGDEKEAVRVCESAEVKLFTFRADVPSLAEKSGKTLEEQARDVRYEFFEKTAREHSIDRIAVAHNMSDNLETEIFNLARGSGLAGLRGIVPVRQKIIRPLIHVSKSEIIDYCKNEGIPFRIDSTNDDTLYSRNFIRKNIVPSLKKINPEIESAVMRTCEFLREDEDFISGCAGDYICRECEELKIPLSSFAKLHAALKKRVLILLYRRFSGNNSSCSLSSRRIESMLLAARMGKSGSKVRISGDVFFAIEFGKAFFESAEEKITLENKFIHCGDTPFGACTVRMNVFSAGEPDAPDIVYKLFKQAFLDHDKIKGELFVRSRAVGDTIKGDGITKSLKDFFIRKKIPARERDLYPVICDAEGIIWVPDMCVADRVKITKDTKTVVTLKII